jgi:hypothetical protein
LAGRDAGREVKMCRPFNPDVIEWTGRRMVRSHRAPATVLYSIKYHVGTTSFCSQLQQNLMHLTRDKELPRSKRTK